MLSISFEFDEAGFDHSADAFTDGVMRPSLVDSVNRAAARVAKGIGGFLGDNLHRASEFTRQAGGYLEAEPDDTSPAALVFVRRQQASYLGYEIYGGDRRAGDPETLPDGVLVPTRDSAMTADGNLDLDEVSTEKRRRTRGGSPSARPATKSSCAATTRTWCSWLACR